MIFISFRVYDPEYLGKSNHVYIDPQVWPDSIQKKVQTSLVRYNHYLNSDLISHEEVPKFKKQWMVRALEFIPTELLRDEQVYK